MKYLQKIILGMCVCGILTAVSACGRYSEPSPVAGSEYPHNYPHNEEDING